MSLFDYSPINYNDPDPKHPDYEKFQQLRVDGQPSFQWTSTNLEEGKLKLEALSLMLANDRKAFEQSMRGIWLAKNDGYGSRENLYIKEDIPFSTVEKIESLQDINEINEAVNRAISLQGYANIPVELASFYEEEKLLAQQKSVLNATDYLNLKFAIEEARNTRADKALQIKEMQQKLLASMKENEDNLKLRSAWANYERNRKWTEFCDKFFEKKAYIGGTSSLPGGAQYRDVPPGQMLFSIRSRFDDAYAPTFKIEGWMFPNKTVVGTESLYGVTAVNNTYFINIDDVCKVMSEQYKLQGPKVLSQETPRTNYTYYSVPKLNNPYWKYFVKAITMECFPSVNEYQGVDKETRYPLFMDYAENKPWPFDEPELFDRAYRAWIGWGSRKWAEATVEKLQKIANQNVNPTVNYQTNILLPRDIKYADDANAVETLYPQAKLNPEYSEIEYQKLRYRFMPEIYITKQVNFANEWNPFYKDLSAKYNYSDPRFNEEYKAKQTELYAKYGLDAAYFAAWNNSNYNRAVSWLEVQNQIGRTKATYKYLMNDLTKYWYSPRPQPGMAYIPKIGYVNPSFMTGAYLTNVETPGYVETQRRQAAERQAYWDSVANIFTGAGDGILGAIGMMDNLAGFLFTGDPKGSALSLNLEMSSKVIGTALKELNPITLITRGLSTNPLTEHLYRELDKLTGGLLTSAANIAELPGKALRGDPISQADLLEALELALKVVAIVATGGSSAAVIAASSNQLKKGTLGQTALGNALLSIGEAVGIAVAVNSAASNVATAAGKKIVAKTSEEVALQAAKLAAEQQIKGALTAEIIKQAGLEDSVIGKIAVTTAVESGATGIKGGNVLDTAKTTTVTGTKTAIASTIPGGQLLMNAGEKVYESGFSSLLPTSSGGGSIKIDSLNPLNIFKTTNWSQVGKDITAAAKDKNTQKIVVAVASGKVDPTTIATNIINKENEKAITADAAKSAVPLTEEQKQTQAFQAQVNADKAKQNTLSKISSGKLPTVNELRSLHPEAEKFFDYIKKALPESKWSLGLKIGLNLGLPDLNFGKAAGAGLDLNFDLGIKMPSIDLGLNLPGVNMPDVDLIEIIKSMLPKNVPLIPLLPYRTFSSPVYQANIIDIDGNVTIRKSLEFSPYEHSMLKFGQLPRKLTKAQQAYNLSRQMEIQQAMITIEQLQLAETATREQIVSIGG